MRIPAEFKHVVRRLYWGVHAEHPEPHAMVAFALAGLDRSRAEVIMEFLDELLSGRHGPEQVQQAWFDAGADIYFPEQSQLIAFLKLMRESLDDVDT